MQRAESYKKLAVSYLKQASVIVESKLPEGSIHRQKIKNRLKDLNY
jgi:hypothetical protein